MLYLFKVRFDKQKIRCVSSKITGEIFYKIYDFLSLVSFLSLKKKNPPSFAKYIFLKITGSEDLKKRKLVCVLKLKSAQNGRIQFGNG